MLTALDSIHRDRDIGRPKRNPTTHAIMVFPKAAIAFAISFVAAGTVFAAYGSLDGIRPTASGYGIDEHLSATMYTEKELSLTIR